MGTGRKNMKYTIIIIALLSIAAMAQTETSSLRVEEVFSVETPEEFESALADGYPMPWLAEILEDETIPEEDRYWLDCRVRAVMARALHLFYNREGEPVHVEAEGGIRNGESYWREVFIVEPGYRDRSHEMYLELEPPYYFLRTPGYLVDRFGERIGEIATADLKIHLSRDGRLGIYTSGLRMHAENPSHVYFLNSSGDVRDVPIGPRLSGLSSICMSDDGSFTLVACSGSGSTWSRNRDQGMDLEYPDDEVMMHVFTGTGDLIYARIILESPTNNQISPDMRYIGYASLEATYLLDAATGETIYTWEHYGGCYPYFTRNSRYLCVPAVGGAKIFDCETGEVAFDMPGQIPNRNYYEGLSASNDLSVIAGDRILEIPPYDNIQYFNDIFINGELYSSEPMGSRIQEVSPNGYFIDLQFYNPFTRWNGPAVPYTVLSIRGNR